jgi:hypothetical protein
MLPIPRWRGAAVGVYRLWRDVGFAVGAVLAGAGDEPQVRCPAEGMTACRRTIGRADNALYSRWAPFRRTHWHNSCSRTTSYSVVVITGFGYR